MNSKQQLAELKLQEKALKAQIKKEETERKKNAKEFAKYYNLLNNNNLFRKAKRICDDIEMNGGEALIEENITSWFVIRKGHETEDSKNIYDTIECVKSIIPDADITPEEIIKYLTNANENY